MRTPALVACSISLAACQAVTPSTDPPSPQAVSLLGEPLHPPPLDAERRARLVADLDMAKARLAAAPRSEEAFIWLGRRHAYLGEYRAAVEVFTAGLALHPRSHKLLRHRGHRHISLRELDAAITDLSAAARLIVGLPDEVEPDGAPNALGIPTSTSHGNIHYHLGLAHYLRGDFQSALAAYLDCARFDTNDDMRCATAYWTYMILRRLGRPAQARAVLQGIDPDMEVIENHAYHRLLLFFGGELEEAGLFEDVEPGTVAGPTTMYGLGNWHLFEGRPERARRVFEEIVEGEVWPAFGYIAAEAELSR
ncbi:MAG: tetratricopeptide repeat protein [Planctomycetota bacterium]|jgi:tetratricopeptide (TPR) repeat protein|nr:tetratricopeptide repeat protein [Planctomycetota bacterium]MDP6762465.1 tetratricopeptide repeat protein [Planctomycetota bacterium]MDP6989281.1 tetratricopeptide repeat protein [Planctomycetota bacterium]